MEQLGIGKSEEELRDITIIFFCTKLVLLEVELPHGPIVRLCRSVGRLVCIIISKKAGSYNEMSL